MSLNESIVEDAALILPAATLTRSLPRGEGKELGVGIVRSEIGRVKFRKVFLTFTLHSSLSPAIPEEAREGIVAKSATVQTKEPKP